MVLRENRAQQRDGEADAQAGAGGCYDICADIAGAFKLAQITLHGAAAFGHGAGEVGDGDLGAAGVAVVAVGVGGENAGAAAGAVGEAFTPRPLAAFTPARGRGKKGKGPRQ